MFFEPLVRVEVRADPSVGALHRDDDVAFGDDGVANLVVPVAVPFEQVAQGLQVAVAESFRLPRREIPHELVTRDVGQKSDLHQL